MPLTCSLLRGPGMAWAPSRPMIRSALTGDRLNSAPGALLLRYWVYAIRCVAVTERCRMMDVVADLPVRRPTNTCGGSQEVLN